MKDISLSIVDILGFLIPGSILCLALVLVPFILHGFESWSTIIITFYKSNTVVALSIFLVASYLAGFILTQFSIRLLQERTNSGWLDPLKKHCEILEKLIEKRLGSPELIEALSNLSNSLPSTNHLKYARYFQFAKEYIHLKSPELWTDVERWEAHLRLLSGLFIPVLFLWCILLIKFIQSLICGEFLPAFLVFTTLSGLGLLLNIVFRNFPSRRIKEVDYVYISFLTIEK